MLWSELCYSRGAWPVVQEAVSRLVVGKNYDPTIPHYWSCRIRSAVLPIWTAYPLDSLSGGTTSRLRPFILPPREVG